MATVGQWLVHPNAVNAVPENVTLMIDVRDIDGLQRDKTVTRIVNAAKEIARQRLKVSLVSHAPRSQPQTDPLEIEIVNSDDPARCSPSMVQTIEAAAAGLKLKSHKMVSRAYHDALFMSRIAPTGMIFIPCADGKSHRPDEFATTSDIETGTMVLASSLVRLAEGGLGEDVSFSASDLDHHHSDEL